MSTGLILKGASQYTVALHADPVPPTRCGTLRSFRAEHATSCCVRMNNILEQIRGHSLCRTPHFAHATGYITRQTMDRMIRIQHIINSRSPRSATSTLSPMLRVQTKLVTVVVLLVTDVLQGQSEQGRLHRRQGPGRTAQNTQQAAHSTQT